MPTLREVRNRIKGVKTTQQVTKAMKMVAAAKLRRSQEAVMQSRPYSTTLKNLLESLSEKVDTTNYPLLSQRKDIKNVLFIVVTADRGLCGAFNSGIMKRAHEIIDVEYAQYFNRGAAKLICVGRRSVEHFVKNGYNVVEKYSGIFDRLSFDTAKSIAEKAAAMYLAGEVDKVIVINNEFKSMLSAHQNVQTFLPVQPPATKEKKTVSDYIYEPSPEAIINALVPKHLSTQIWKVLLESNAAEQAARMMAMDSATENAKELLRNLSISYNRARQAAITKELIEIVSGANALQ
jgi:F-type H+-transporting ATPase subunit gamma